MEIYPLSMPQVNWDTYINLCDDVLGEKPLAGIDEAGLDLKNPDAFLAGLNFETNAATAIRNATKQYHHLHFSFVTDAAEPVIMQLLLLESDIRVSVKFDRHHVKMLSVISGTLHDWYRAIIDLCYKSRSRDLRYLANCLFIYFEKAGLREVWHQYTKETVKDGTFILKRG